MLKQHYGKFFVTMPSSLIPMKLNQVPKDIESRHLLKQHNKQHCVLLFIILILMQKVEVHACRQLLSRSPHLADASISASIESPDFDTPLRKRAELTHGTSLGQPEEIFAVGDHLESNYDEYPMVVPKRAALLLDRLMVALHNALEKKRIGQKQQNGEFKSIKNKSDDKIDQNANSDSAELDEDVPHIENMYGDDPRILMDYDFKDLNSINRATGETLMEKSFQRRANIGDAGGLALLTSSAGSTSSELIGGGTAGSGRRTSTGPMYWRCYFNAVSCF